MEQTFNVNEAIQAQKKLCIENYYPHFVPNDGRCYNCKKQIYEQIQRGNFTTGISLEKAKAGLITGCPHCNRSYCD